MTFGRGEAVGARSAASSPARPVAETASRAVDEQRVLAQIESLGVLPEVALEVLRIADDPGSSAAELERAIARDPLIAGRLFKLANSSFFSRGAELRTLSQAVRRLGFRTIKSLVLAASAASVLGRRIRAYGYVERGLWDHSIAVALAGRSIARTLGLAGEVESEIFLGGLLHDVGKLVLEPFLRERLPQPSAVSLEVERSALSLDHAQVGARIAERWRLPRHAAAVIRSHHAPREAEEFARQAGVVALSDHLLLRQRVGLAPNAPAVDAPPATALDLLGLGAEDLDALGAEVAARLEESGTLLGEIAA